MLLAQVLVGTGPWWHKIAICLEDAVKLTSSGKVKFQSDAKNYELEKD